MKLKNPDVFASIKSSAAFLSEFTCALVGSPGIASTADTVPVQPGTSTFNRNDREITRRLTGYFQSCSG